MVKNPLKKAFLAPTNTSRSSHTSDKSLKMQVNSGLSGGLD